MQRRILLALIAFLCVPSVVDAQKTLNANAFPAASPTITDEASLKNSLEAGYALEREHLWADALVHYEDASRQYPSSLDVKQRLQIVRIRFDLSRRYADGSFVDSARHLTVNQAIELLREVCVKISHTTWNRQTGKRLSSAATET